MTNKFVTWTGQMFYKCFSSGNWKFYWFFMKISPECNSSGIFFFKFFKWFIKSNNLSKNKYLRRFNAWLNSKYSHVSINILFDWIFDRTNTYFLFKKKNVQFSRLKRSMITQYIINCLKTFNTCISCIWEEICLLYITTYVYIENVACNASKMHFINNTKDHHFICKQHTTNIRVEHYQI